MTTNEDPRVAAARARWAEHGPLGRWCSIVGTANALRQDHLQFLPDGSGVWIETGPFFHPRSELAFRWRSERPSVIQLCAVASHGLPPYDDYGLELEPIDREWLSADCNFEVVETDLGDEVGLRLTPRPCAVELKGAFHFALAMLPPLQPLGDGPFYPEILRLVP